MKRNYMLRTDPSLVQGVANKLRMADGVFVRFEGTFAVGVTADSPETVLNALIPIEGYTHHDIKECV